MAIFFHVLSKVFERSLALFVGLACIIPEAHGWLHIAALISFIVFAIIIFVRLILLIYRSFFRKYSTIQNSMFVTYKTLNNSDTEIELEMYKHIKCQRAIMSKYAMEFKWSGDSIPKISSHMQKVREVVTHKRKGEPDTVMLDLSENLYYNDSTIIHFKAEVTDTIRKSGTYVQTRIDYKTDVVHYRIQLGYKPVDYDIPARVERVPINSKIAVEYEKIKDVPFDLTSKSYEYHLLNPEVGYKYRIAWTR